MAVIKKQVLLIFFSLSLSFSYLHCSIPRLAISLEISQVSFSLKDSKGVPLDYKLAKIMNFKNGTFIEVGAFDGINYSNTKLFEEFYGWTGVLVEPSEVLFSRLCENRGRNE